MFIIYSGLSNNIKKGFWWIIKALFKQIYCTLLGTYDTGYNIDTDKLEYDDDHFSKGEICDEDEFVPFSDGNGSDSEEESVNPNLSVSISEELVDGNVTVVMTRS